MNKTSQTEYKSSGRQEARNKIEGGPTGAASVPETVMRR